MYTHDGDRRMPTMPVHDRTRSGQRADFRRARRATARMFMMPARSPQRRPSMTTTASIERMQAIDVPMLIGGRWEVEPVEPTAAPSSTRRPAASSRAVPFCTADEVDRAVQAAAAALPAWAETPVVERARVMFRFRESWLHARRGAGAPGHARARQDPRRGARRSSAASRSSSSPAAFPA